MSVSREKIEHIRKEVGGYILTSVRAKAERGFVVGAPEASSIDGSYGITIRGIQEMMREDRGFKGRIQDIRDETLEAIIRECLISFSAPGKDKKIERIGGRGRSGFMRRIKFLRGREEKDSAEKKTKTILRRKTPKAAKEVVQEKECLCPVDLSAKHPAKPAFRKRKGPPTAEEKIGRKNELRFFKLMQEWIESIKRFLLKKHIAVRLRKSQDWDWNDTRGDDISIWFFVKGEQFRFVYDVKSSAAYAVKFNNKAKSIPLGKNIVLKKAIVVHDHRKDEDILKEVRGDITTKLGITFQ